MCSRYEAEIQIITLKKIAMIISLMKYLVRETLEHETRDEEEEEEEELHES